jgi:hypothetical protein
VRPRALPPRCSAQIFLFVRGQAQAGCDAADGEVVGGVLDCAGNTPLVAVLTDVSERFPVCQCCPAFFVFEAQVGNDFGVFEQRGVAVGPVDPVAQAFDVCVCEDVVGVRSALA